MAVRHHHALPLHLRGAAGDGGAGGLLRRVDLPRPLDLRLGRLSKRVHLACAWLVAGSTALSAYFILADLAVGFREPLGGEVRLGGVPAGLIGGERLREAVRLAPQDAYLFTSSLRDNVALGRAGADDEDLEAALRSVGLGPWLESLPYGLDTEVGEAGARVSGGQRQRIAAARLFLARARFLVFDEPTAHLDPAGAADLQRRIAGLARQGVGVLAITHEPAGLDAFDEVLELRDGRLAPRRLQG